MYSSPFTSLIVTYNSAEEVVNLLNDLHSHAPANPIIVVDNASRDDTAGMIQKYFPRVQLIRNVTNVGYAKAVNQGFERCDSEHVLLLNPDIRISSPQVFSEMERCVKQSPQIAAAAPLQFKNDEKKNSLNLTWSYSTPSAFKVYLSFLLKRTQVFSRPIRVTLLNAGCVLIRRAAFEQVGKLNEKYFMYGEEPDLFLKFRRYGFECYLLPNTAVTHYRERSLKTMPTLEQARIKFQAVRNLIDAFLAGWAGIILDKLVVNKSRLEAGKKPLSAE
jgi:N-acetylglucosaminyl-diphospho-decaprenol L-rhamnosyltransferase